MVWDASFLKWTSRKLSSNSFQKLERVQFCERIILNLPMQKLPYIVFRTLSTVYLYDMPNKNSRNVTFVQVKLNSRITHLAVYLVIEADASDLEQYTVTLRNRHRPSCCFYFPDQVWTLMTQTICEGARSSTDPTLFRPNRLGCSFSLSGRRCRTWRWSFSFSQPSHLSDSVSTGRPRARWNKVRRQHAII